MKEEINKAIDSFSKGDKNVAKILALFSAQIIVIFGRNFTKRINDEMLELNQALINGNYKDNYPKK